MAANARDRPRARTRKPRRRPEQKARIWVYLMSDCILFSILFATYAVLVNGTVGGPDR